MTTMTEQNTNSNIHMNNFTFAYSSDKKTCRFQYERLRYDVRWSFACPNEIIIVLHVCLKDQHICLPWVS